jgi:putative tricarboxylic transport membrane protein
MRLNDAVLGCLLLLLAGGIAVVARTFPPVPGQDYGAAAFPLLIAAGFAGCGLVLVASGLRARAPFVVWRDWTRDRGRRLDVLAVIAGIVFYILTAGTLGFIPTMTLVLLVLLRRFGVGWGPSLALAVVAPLVMQYLFGSLLLVPLPWGLLAPVRWW